MQQKNKKYPTYINDLLSVTYINNYGQCFNIISRMFLYFTSMGTKYC